MTSADDPLLVQTEPTKDFFITMLVRDIQLIPAIVDLVDNCVDGAMRQSTDGRFEGLWVKLTIGSNHFKIADNCGGIPVGTARDYAFRFGRPAGMQSTAHSIGQFGVGMKRALFKLGSEFTVTSNTESEGFDLHVDVEKWRLDSGWHFRFSSVRDHGVQRDEAGTIVEVTRLHPSVSEDFSTQQFANDLATEIAAKHQAGMDTGLAISVNGVPINVNPAQLLQSDRLKAASEYITLNGDTPVGIRLYAGLGQSNPKEAGWYVYCNGRLILAADQSETTGWGTDDGKRIPRYHNQFARFRGYAFFESDDASRLPWTTTKTGVDANAGVFRHARTRMIVLMRPVIDFLNRLDSEINSPPDDAEPLDGLVGEAVPVRIADLDTRDAFALPERSRYQPPATQSVQYRIETPRADKAKRVLKVGSLGELGRKTFDYFYKLECEDDE